MLHVSTLSQLVLDRPACVTIGAFDGVHRGHQALIKRMTDVAHAQGQAAVVITFYPHPSVVLRGRRPSFYLSTPDEKAEYIAALGVDALVTQTFDQAFSLVTASDYVHQLRTHARLAELWCGPDFALGHKRQGDVAFLTALGEQHNFRITRVEPLLFDGEIISSTRIRQCLRDGAVEQAQRYLGHPFRLIGEVIHGLQRGRTIGIPTANLAVNEECAVPSVGVYACKARTSMGEWLAVTNIGYRPTFNSDPTLTIEAHLLDFDADLYGQTLTLEFSARLRSEMKFPGIEALVAQIQRDIETARQLLSTTAVG